MTPSLDTAVLRELNVRAWRLHLSTPGVLVTVPLLRGVWGAALRDGSQERYREVFEGDEVRVPRYLMRPAPREADPAPAVEFIVFGRTDQDTDSALWAAWDEAERRGLGPERRPFRITAAIPLAWDETPLGPARVQPGFALDPMPWPTGSIAAGCRIDIPAPLRLLRQGRLIDAPTPADLALAALRRIGGLLGSVADPLWERRADWLDAARAVPHRPWRGRRLDLVRYSGSQHREVELRGVVGSLDLPHGPGPLAPLLAAAQWLHLGKGTVMGLGQVRILPLDVDKTHR
ncbi:CRISPR system precrRNA processing endoribonuclease RAMP protein Cas6 [Tautonia marina]|uniref:CRISPR system precrRNA processing endoribonuclease RAMP protein Cas6 n=1 Tax=Tautonia marina TaxID=2653855 RepID=UPI0013756294|nr:CRISPR system precrRNA processing endoribonuclease RAMP protein Cas6 [Tautonia marina]